MRIAFDQILKRNFWAPLLVLVGAAAYLNAHAITQLVGIALAPDDKQLAMTGASDRSSRTAGQDATKATSADAILSRNPFDSVTGPLDKKAVGEYIPSGDGGLDINDPMSVPLCDGVKVLVIAASADPDWSLAAFSTTSDKDKTILRRRGGDVGGKTVQFIGWDRAWLTMGSSLCQVQMFRPQTKSETPAAAPAPAAHAPAGGAPGVPDDIRKGIRKNSANDYDVDRAVVDKILENQADLMRQARIVPEQQNGKTVGIRMYGVRSDTLLGVLGMQNGDLLQSINGFDIASPEKALEAYARLRTADQITLQFQRGGTTQNLDYHIK